MGARFRLWVHRWAAGLGLAGLLLHGGLAAAFPPAHAGNNAPDQVQDGGANLARSRPSREKLRQRIAATQTVAEAASLLEAVAVEDFDNACNVLVNRRLGISDVMYLFLERTQELAKARRAVDFLLKHGYDVSSVAARIAMFPEDKGVAVKQQLLREMVDKADASSRRLLLADLVELGFAGKVQSPAVWRLMVEWVRADPSAAAQLDERMASRWAILDRNAVLSAIKTGKADALAVVQLNRQICVDSIDHLLACGEDIQKAFGASASALEPNFARAALYTLSTTSSVTDIPKVSAIYAPLGLDRQALVDNLCKRALDGMKHDSPEVDTIAEAISAIDAKHSCGTSFVAARTWHSGRNTLGFILRALVLLAPLAVTLLLLRHKYKPVREGLAAAPAPVSATWGPGAITERLNENTWSSRFDAALHALRGDLERSGDGASCAAAAAIARLESSSLDKLTEHVRLIAIAALERGVPRSILARIDGMLVYTLVFPGLHDDPRSIRRYTPLAGGWLTHMEMIGERLCKGQDAGAPLLALLVFLRPDASEGLLLFGYDDGQVSVSPGLVLEESERRKARGRVHADGYPLPLA